MNLSQLFSFKNSEETYSQTGLKKQLEEKVLSKDLETLKSLSARYYRIPLDHSFHCKTKISISEEDYELIIQVRSVLKPNTIVYTFKELQELFEKIQRKILKAESCSTYGHAIEVFIDDQLPIFSDEVHLTYKYFEQSFDDLKELQIKGFTLEDKCIKNALTIHEKYKEKFDYLLPIVHLT
ncbi:hypothetical protein HON22_03935 [Candidatus Peregrinibacteria bacterium]|jgi:hypothetical protein|nr:hypothetical protein [Candidatus Peregrinibacteria bacterium]